MNDPLLRSIEQFLRKMELPWAGLRLGVAVSGGADSVVLLHALHRLTPQFGFELSAIHVNHQLRGAESDDDERFVRELAGELAVPSFIIRRVNEPNENLEQAARDVRRAVFRQLIGEDKANYVALGHTGSDQAETVLFRLARGTGTAGLAGMRPLSKDRLLRPMLGLFRTDVRDWAMRNGLLWREDSSNDDLRFRRNLIRKHVLPALRDGVNQSVEAALARTAEVAQGEEDFWNDLVQHHLEACISETHFGVLINVGYLGQQPLALRRRLVRHACRTARGDLRSLDIAHIDAVLSICGSMEGHDRVLIPGVDALRSFGTLRLAPLGSFVQEKRHYRVSLIPGVETVLPHHAGRICLQLSEAYSTAGICVNFKSEKERNETVMLGLDALGGREALHRLVVRNWEPGDKFQPAGHKNAKKIKELFQESKVLLWERKHWPVLELNDQIVWSRRFGPAACFVPEQSTHPVVALSYRAADESIAVLRTS